MLTLMEWSWKSSYITFEEVIELPETDNKRLIYDKIVENARKKIRKALRKNKTELTLKMIHLCATQPIIDTAYRVLGNLTYYRGSMWRIATFYAVSSFVFTVDNQERIKDVFSVVDMVLPYKNLYNREAVENGLYEIVETIENGEDPDIVMFTNAYLGCKEYLLPYLVDPLSELV